MTEFCDDDISEINRKYQSLKPHLADLGHDSAGANNYRHLAQDLRDLAELIDPSKPVRAITLRPKISVVVDPIYKFLHRLVRPLLKVLFAQQIRFNKASLYLFCRMSKMEQKIEQLQLRIKELER